MSEIVVYKNRTNTIKVSLGVDVSSDTFAAQIREKANSASPVVATWSWEFETNGVDGVILLTLQNEDLAAVTVKSGYTDVKRISGGEPLAVFAPVKVVFVDTVTE